MIPDLIDIGKERKVLPLGRYLCTLEEIEKYYVPEGNAKRKQIFDALLFTIKLLRESFGSVCEVWIGGSFITSKEQPNDIDVLFVIDHDLYEHARETPVGRFVISAFGRSHGLHELVDSYVLFIHPTGLQVEEAVEDEYDYMRARGYWDQFWSKTRLARIEESGKSYPSAGYLEVVLDGYGA